MLHLWIAGAGGFGRELFHWIHAHPQHGVEFRFAGYLDDRLHALDGFNYPGAVIQSIDTFDPGPDDRVVMGVGLPTAKRDLARRFDARGAQYFTFIHHTAVVGGNVQLGRGCVLCPHSIVTADVVLGDFVMLNLSAHVAHDSRVGDYVTLSPHCDITGWVRVGQGVFFGVGAATIPGVSIGEWSTLAAGAIAMRDIPAGVTAAGNPARLLPHPEHQNASRRDAESAEPRTQTSQT